jgi:HEAT repeat protein
MISDVRRLGFMHLWDRLEPYLLNYMVPVLMRLEVDLTTASIRRTSMTEPADQIAEARMQKSPDDEIRFKWRFIHLTFQEFFVARRLLTTLRLQLRQKSMFASARGVYKALLDDKLYDAWYREALLLLASSADDGTFSDMIDYLLSESDASGVREHLVVVMLEERREHPKYAAKKATVKKAQEARLFASIVAAMSHPYPYLRKQAAQQLRSLEMSIGNVAKQVSDELKSKHCSWFGLVAMMESLIDIRETYEQQGGEEASVIGDGKSDTALATVIATTLLVHEDLDVVTAAARGLGAIGVTTNPVMFGLLEKLDNGHRYVLQDVCVALLQLGMGWHEIIKQIMTRTQRPALRSSTCPLDDETPNAEWLSVADALGNVLPSEEAKLAAIPELERVLHHADVEVSLAGARSLGKLGGGAQVIEFCKEWLQPEQPLQDRLSALKALRGLGQVQLQMAAEMEQLECTPRTVRALELERPRVLDMFVELLGDGESVVRGAAASALLSLQREGDDAWSAAVAHVSSYPLEAAGVEQLVEGAAALALVHPAGGANRELVEKLHDVMEKAEWRLSKSAAGSLVLLAPGDPKLGAALSKWLRDGFEVPGHAAPADPEMCFSALAVERDCACV